MADYYPLIARAITGLDPNGPGEQRRALYERARTALIAQLRNARPPLTEAEITRERLALEDAVRRVEADAARRAAQISVSTERKRDKEMSTTLQEPEAHVGRRRESIRSLPPLSAIPEQNLKRAIGFLPTRRGPLDLVSDPPTDPNDPEQSMLYARIRQQLNKMKEDIPRQERSQINDAIDDFLAQPKDWGGVEFKKILWLSGNTLRSMLAQHDAVSNDPEHYAKLPPAVAESLRNPIQAWSIFVQGDQELAELDRFSLGPQETANAKRSLAAASDVLNKVIDDRGILTERAAHAVAATIKSASTRSTDVSTKLAGELADKTSRNVVSQILRRAYLIREAILDPQSDAAKEVAGDLAKGATQAAGALALTAAVAATTNALPFLQFVASNPILIKEYIVIAFQSAQMVEIVDAIEFEYLRLKKMFEDTQG